MLEIVGGFLAVGIVHAAVVSFRLPAPGDLWLSVHYLLAGQFIGAGLMVAGGVSLLERLEHGWRRIASLVVLTASSVLLRHALEEDVKGPAERVVAVVPEVAVYWLAGVGGGLAIVGAGMLGRILARRWLRWGGVSGAMVLAGANAVLLPFSYPGLHAVAAIAAALFAAGSLADADWPLASCASPPSRIRLGWDDMRVSWRPWMSSAAFGVGVLVTAPAFLFVPSNALAIALLRQPAAVFVPFLVRMRPPPELDTRVPGEQREWFMDRAPLPPIPASRPPVLGDLRLTVLIGVDSMRADLLEEDEYRERLPELFRLRDESIWFGNARSPGASTAPSLAALFAGVHYSQLYWTTHERRRPEVFPHEDPTPRFSELLTHSGVVTSTVDSAGWLLNEFGIVRGFTHQESARTKRGYPSAKALTKRLLAKVDEHGRGGSEQHFAFAHFLDAHAPYTSAGKKKTPFDGYLAELGLVDREIGRLRRFLAKRHLDHRTVLIVFADHGEAFGEHGLKWHASSLYESMIRVPLLIHVPGALPRRVDDAVSLVDLGPTILDLYGLATPSHFMGQSLVPALQGEVLRLTRPILAEARLKRAMVAADGYKIIHDTRNGTVELYDTRRDPGELENLYATEAARGRELLETLSTYFARHTHRRPGYTVPYRKW